MALPPDQLNGEGFYDARPQPFRQRRTKRMQKAGRDARANTRPLPLPEPGVQTIYVCLNLRDKHGHAASGLVHRHFLEQRLHFISRIS